MDTETSTSAILIFSRAAREEASVKNFSTHPNPAVNLSIAHQLIERTLKIAQKTDVPVITAYSDEQQGNTFEKRLRNAIQQVFEQGYEKVITIGTDCPGITPKLLLEANRQLSENDLVLGPALDGGVYLIAMNQKAFSQQRFLSLKWQSRDLIQSFKSYAHSQKLCLHFLEAKRDIDSASDFLSVINMMPFRSEWIAGLRSLSSYFLKKTSPIQINIPFGNELLSPTTRPPPFLA